MENPNLPEIKFKMRFLTDILERKLDFLKQIYGITENQELFEKTMSGEDREVLLREAVREKQKIIDELIAADNTFIRVFGEFKGELNRNRDKFKDDIKIMQEKIRLVSDMDFKIRAKEMRAKQGIKVQNNVFQEKIKTLKSSKSYIINKYKKNSGKSHFDGD